MQPVSEICLQLARICDDTTFAQSVKHNLMQSVSKCYIDTPVDDEEILLKISEVFRGKYDNLPSEIDNKIFDLCSKQFCLEFNQRKQLSHLFKQFSSIQGDEKDSCETSMNNFLNSPAAQMNNLEDQAVLNKQQWDQPGMNYVPLDAIQYYSGMHNEIYSSSQPLIASNEWDYDDNNNNLSSTDWISNNLKQSTVITQDELDKYKRIDDGNKRKRKLEEADALLEKSREEYTRKVRQKIAEKKLQDQLIEAEKQKVVEWEKIQQKVLDQKDSWKNIPQLIWNHLALAIKERRYDDLRNWIDNIVKESQSKNFYTVSGLLNHTDENGNSLLHYIVQSDYIPNIINSSEKNSLIIYLIQKGCDPNIANKEGKTPLDQTLDAFFELEEMKAKKQSISTVKNIDERCLTAIIHFLDYGAFINNEYYQPSTENEFFAKYPNKISLLIESNFRIKKQNQSELISALAKSGVLLGLNIDFDTNLESYADSRVSFFDTLNKLVNPLLLDCQFDKIPISNYINNPTAITNWDSLVDSIGEIKISSDSDFLEFCLENFYLILANLNRGDIKNNQEMKMMLVRSLEILYNELPLYLGMCSLSHLSRAAFWMAEVTEIKQKIKKEQDLIKSPGQQYFKDLAENPTLNRESIHHPYFFRTLNNWYIDTVRRLDINEDV